ncbi:g1349 [Coccomyxa viridis]|uniref:G1349 protein n=1 Tax=Coccomyxa viridis TaxID=1274662 RepID=A0ABP1FJF7_9CHLO
MKHSRAASNKCAAVPKAGEHVTQKVSTFRPQNQLIALRMDSAADKEVAQNLACERCSNGCKCDTQCDCGPTCTCSRCNGRRGFDPENECAHCMGGNCDCQTPENCKCGQECLCKQCRV